MTDDDLTGVAPTELGGAIDDTEAVTAWSLDDGEEWTQRRSWRPVIFAVAMSLVLLAGAGVLAASHLRQPATGIVTMQAPRSAGLEGSATIDTGETGFKPPTTSTREPPPTSRGTVTTYTTYLGWKGASCLHVRFPNRGTIETGMTCRAGNSDAVQIVAATGDLIGADPIMGQNVSISCRTMIDSTNVTLVYDTGTVGDGHDVNCMLTAP